MIALWQITDTDFGIAALVIIVLAYLVYRAFRREPLDRVVRIGVFIERMKNGNGKNAKPHDADVHHIAPDDAETKIDWPQREEEP